jgi:hypothetical protein
MRLPSKVTPFKDSILAKLPLVLNEVKVSDISVMNLYTKIKTDDTSDFLERLDCLFALRKIEFVEHSEEIHYVD